jgi:hypothetical protein
MWKPEQLCFGDNHIFRVLHLHTTDKHRIESHREPPLQTDGQQVIPEYSGRASGTTSTSTATHIGMIYVGTHTFSIVKFGSKRFDTKRSGKDEWNSKGGVWVLISID